MNDDDEELLDIELGIGLMIAILIITGIAFLAMMN